MAIVGTSIKSLADSNKHQGRVGTIRVGHVTGGPKWVVSVGKDKDKKIPTISASTFRKVELEMDMARNSILKLRKILSKEVKVESRVRDAFGTGISLVMTNWSFTESKTSK